MTSLTERERRTVRIIVGSGLMVAVAVFLIVGISTTWPVLIAGGLLLMVGLLVSGIFDPRRFLRITGGIVVLIIGLFMAIPGVPGPGLVVIFIGLSILAVDFVWAHRLKTKMKDTAGKVVDKVRGVKKN